MSVPGPKLIH